MRKHLCAMMLALAWSTGMAENPNEQLSKELQAWLDAYGEIYNRQDYAALLKLWDQEDPDVIYMAEEIDPPMHGWPRLNAYFNPKPGVQVLDGIHNRYVFASSSGMSFYQDAVAKGAKFKWDIALLPQSGKPTLNLYGASVSVYKTTPEKELAAWLTIKFLGEKTQTTKWAVATGYLPVRQSAKADTIAAYKANPAWGSAAVPYAKTFDWVQYSMIESPVAGYDPVRTDIIVPAMEKVMADPAADVKKLLDDGVTKANQILKENAPK